MTTSTGKYFFTKFRSGFAIWTLASTINGISTYDKVFTHWCYETTVREMYRLNGWKQPKQVIQKF